MFLKFVIYPSQDGDQKTQETLIECAGFNQSYYADDDENNGYACFAIDDKSGPNVNVDCANTRVYVMNDNGKTIDSYHWRNIDGVIKRL